VREIRSAPTCPRRTGSSWDTLGWIYYKMGNLSLAESYLDAAWQLTQDGVVGDHLGQLYEKEQKLSAALHIYSLALEANPRLEETPGRMRKLAHVPSPASRVSAGEELSRMRIVKLPKIIRGTASADFYILLAPGGKVSKAAFFRGSELLRFAGDSLEKATIKEPFPPNSEARLLRKGILSCSSYTGCSFLFLSAFDDSGRKLGFKSALILQRPAPDRNHGSSWMDSSPALLNICIGRLGKKST
jgi:tetratricopeptide (TPR) repeat protein